LVRGGGERRHASGPQFMHWSEAAITWGCEDHP
jgi:hypothetical protein